MIAGPFGAQPAPPAPVSAGSLSQISATDLSRISEQPSQAEPSILILSLNTLTCNGDPVTISGTPAFFASKGLILGSSTLNPQEPSGYQQSLLTTLGQTFVPDPISFSIASRTLLPNGPAVTISDIPVSMNPTALVVGSSTISFLPTYQSTFADKRHNRCCYLNGGVQVRSMRE